MIAVPISLLTLNRSVEAAGYTFIILHFRELDLDYGRKVVEPLISELCKYFCNQLVKDMVKDRKRETYLLRGDGGGDEDGSLEAWKIETQNHANAYPIEWRGEPLQLVSVPRQEQEVVALFHGLVAAGHLEGWRVLAAAETNRTYDSIMTHTSVIEHSEEAIHGIPRVTGDTGPMKVVEFKYALSRVLREFENAEEGSKRFEDVDVLIAWIAGDFENGECGTYFLESVCMPESIGERLFVGQTHILKHEVGTIPVILLEDLLDVVNNGDDAMNRQRGRYLQD
jgi:hypothetical protein